MKLKHLITLTTSCGLLVILAGLVWTWVVFKEKVTPKPPAQVPPLDLSQHVPDPVVVRRMVELEDFMKGLRLARKQNEIRVNLSAFGDEETRIRAKMAGVSGGKGLLDETFPYRVSFAFSAGKTGFCVINGTFYQKGAKTESGLRVLDVKADSVLLEKNGTRRWIPVALPGVQTALAVNQAERQKEEKGK